MVSVRKNFAKSMRESFGMIAAVILIIGLIGIPSTFKEVTSIWAAKVNGRAISYQTYMREMVTQQERMQAFRAQYGQFADYLLASMGISSDPKQLALDTLIRQELLNELADNNHIALHPQFIVEKINDYDYVQNNLSDIVPLFILDQEGAINPEMLKLFTSRMGMSIGEFEQRVEQGLSRQFMMTVLQPLLYVPQFDSAYAMQMKHAKRNVSYITLNFSDALTLVKQEPISDEAARNYFEHHNLLSKRYWEPERRSGVVWTVDAQKYPISIDKNDVRNYYEAHKNEKYIKNPAKVVIQTIRQSELQKKDSNVMLDDIYEQVLQGKYQDLWKQQAPFAKGELDPAIEKQAFSLKNVGDVSSVIETKDNEKIIIKLVSRLQREYESISSVQKDIVKELKNELFQKQFVSEVKRIVEHQSQTELDTFISRLGVEKTVLNQVSRRDNEENADKLFSVNVGGFDVFSVGNTGKIVQVTDSIPSFQPRLEEVIDVVKNDIYLERAADRFDAMIEEEKELFVNGRSTATVKKTGLFSSNEKDSVKNLQKAKLPVSQLLELEKEGSVIVHKSKDIAFVCMLDEVQPQDFPLKDQEIQEESQAKKMLTMEGLVASLYRNAKIETNDTIIVASEEYSI